MAELPPLSVHEVLAGDWVLRLDGTVLELFHAGTEIVRRRHVRFLAVEGKDREGGLALTVGMEVSGQVIGDRVFVPAAQRDDVMALFAEARRRRDMLLSA